MPNYQWPPLLIVLLIYFMFGSDQWASAHLPFFSLIILCLQTNINHFWPIVCDGIPSVSTKPRPTPDCCSVMDVFDNLKQIFPEKELRVHSQSQFPHSCVCERYMYSHDRSAYSSCRKNVDRSWEYINRSQTHECGNWYWGRATPRTGMHKWDFCCSVEYVKRAFPCKEPRLTGSVETECRFCNFLFNQTLKMIHSVHCDGDILYLCAEGKYFSVFIACNDYRDQMVVWEENTFGRTI